MSKFLKRLISSFLLCVFCLYITPKEVMHALTHHLDTEHHVVNDKDGLAISNPHHHCELLKMDQQFAAFDIHLPWYDFSVRPYFFDLSFISDLKEIVHSNVYSCRQLRAPPVVVV